MRERISAAAAARLREEERRKREWTREGIVGVFQDFRDLYGRNPTAADLRKRYGLPAYRTLVQHFGSLKNALIEAGLLNR